jgi:hypothetical protein
VAPASFRRLIPGSVKPGGNKTRKLMVDVEDMMMKKSSIFIYAWTKVQQPSLNHFFHSFLVCHTLWTLKSHPAEVAQQIALLPKLENEFKALFHS